LAQADSVYDASTGILRIIGTGEGISPGTGAQYPNWKLVAFPTSGSNLTPAITTPRDVYIPGTTPAVWYPGSNTTNQGISGVGFAFGSTYHWATVIGDGTPISPFNPGDIPNSLNYSYVVSTDFTATEAGTCTFNYNMSGDNRIAVYLGGTPTATASPYISNTTNPPTNPFDYVISGGQLLAFSTKGPGFLTSGIGPGISLAAGTYTLNYLVIDFNSG
jgi:hypothetical protein